MQIKLQKKGEKTPTSIPLQEFESTFHIIYRPELVFPSKDIQQEVSNNCPYLLRNRWIASEYYDWNKVWPTQKDAPIYIKWIDPTMGYGVFAEEDIEAGTCIGEYTGVVRRLFRNHPDHNAYCFHYPTRLWSWKYFAIDALHEGNFTRFINHSDTPNLNPSCLIKDRILHLVFIANRRILKGSQLTFSYGEDYWMKRQKHKLRA
ncbi:MAG: SET domain-containing protein [Parachlamydiaceae bacterium]